MSNEVKTQWVIDVIKTAVTPCPDNGDIQLTILTRALARAAKILQIEKDVVVANFEKAYDTEEIASTH